MQNSVKEFAEQYHLHGGLEDRYIDLVSEVGELGKEILKSSNYGQAEAQVTAAFADELGDCLFSLLHLCNLSQLDAEALLAGAIDKYEGRWREKNHIGSM